MDRSITHDDTMVNPLGILLNGFVTRRRVFSFPPIASNYGSLDSGRVYGGDKTEVFPDWFTLRVWTARARAMTFS